MQEAGKIKHIGLSEVTVAQLEEARTYVEIAAIQNQYNLLERKYDDVVDYAEKEGIVFVPWFPLGRGNLSLYADTLQMLAEKYHATPTQITLAWLLKRSSVMLPIPGSLSPEHLKENSDAIKIDLSEEDYLLLTDKKQ